MSEASCPNLEPHAHKLHTCAFYTFDLSGLTFDDPTCFTLTRALRARRARPPEVPEKLPEKLLCASSVRKHLVR